MSCFKRTSETRIINFTKKITSACLVWNGINLGMEQKVRRQPLQLLSRLERLDVLISLTHPLPRSLTNSPYCLQYSSCDASAEKLVLDQLIIP